MVKTTFLKILIYIGLQHCCNTRNGFVRADNLCGWDDSEAITGAVLEGNPHVGECGAKWAGGAKWAVAF